MCDGCCQIRYIAAMMRYGSFVSVQSSQHINAEELLCCANELHDQTVDGTWERIPLQPLPNPRSAHRSRRRTRSFWISGTVVLLYAWVLNYPPIGPTTRTRPAFVGDQCLRPGLWQSSVGSARIFRRVCGLCLVVDLSIQSRHVRVLSVGLDGSQKHFGSVYWNSETTRPDLTSELYCILNEVPKGQNSK